MSDDTPTANLEQLEGFRAGLQASMGNVSTWGEDRDIYDVFGWPEDPSPEDYLSLYLRNGYARVVVDKPAQTTWRDDPIIEDTADQKSTQFEDDVASAARNLDLWSYGARIDRVAGVAQHGLLLIGLNDVTEELENWATDARDESYSGLDAVTNLKPVLQTEIEDIDWGGPESERWGKPVEYTVDLDGIDETLDVHWSRAIDVPATRLFDDATKAPPRIEPVLNNLLDIEKTLGSAAEQSYRGADYGLHLNFDPEKVDPDSVSDSDLKDEFNRWYHGLQPEFKTVGAQLDSLGGEMQDPTGIIEPEIEEIASQTGIPKRELRGNQQGEQAGAEQDERSYFGTIEERRRQYATPLIVRRTIGRLTALDLITSPVGGDFTVSWPDLTQLSTVEQAQVEKNRSAVVQAVPGLAGETALQYIKHGADAIPEPDSHASGDIPMQENAWVDALDEPLNTSENGEAETAIRLLNDD